MYIFANFYLKYSLWAASITVITTTYKICFEQKQEKAKFLFYLKIVLKTQQSDSLQIGTVLQVFLRYFASSSMQTFHLPWTLCRYSAEVISVSWSCRRLGRHHYSSMEKSENFAQHSLLIGTPLYWNKNEQQLWKIIVIIKFSQFNSDMENYVTLCQQKTKF